MRPVGARSRGRIARGRTEGRRLRPLSGRVSQAAGVLAAALAAAPVGAHHSAAIFDSSAIVVLQGTVKRFSWTNPHVYIYVDVPDVDGTEAEWSIETDPIPILLRNGWAADSFRPGDTITVRAHPEKDRSHKHVLLASAIAADGTVLTPRADAHRDVARAQSIAGIWDGLPGYATRAFVYGPLTPKGAAAQAAYTEAENPVADCIAYPTPAIVTAPYLNEIVVRQDSVLIRSEFFGVERVVYTDGRGHPADGPLTNQGHSIGRWEDGALIVDTALLAPDRDGNREGIPSSASKHVVERYALSEDHKRLEITFEVEDPEYLAEPMTGSIEWDYAPDRVPARIDCDPEIAKRYIVR